MLGISDERAEEIFEEQPDRKQQRKKELEEQGKLEEEKQKIVEDSSEPEPETGEPEEVELVACPECGDEFDTEQGMKVHKGQVH